MNIIFTDMDSPHPGLANCLFVVFADDWGRHPSSCQHLFRRILPHSQVVWVNTIGLRTPRIGLYDLRRAWEVLSGWFGRPKTTKGTPPNNTSFDIQPEILRPMMLPWFQFAWAEWVNYRLIRKAVLRRIAQKTQGQTILVTTLPIVPKLFEESCWTRRIYYCVDDFTTWDGIAGQVMEKLEQKTLERADVVIATSTSLLRTRGPKSRIAHLLTHGVDVGHFIQASQMPDHSDLDGFPHPIIGLFGSFDARIDGKLLLAIAKAISPGTLVVIGPVDRDLSEFAAEPCIRFMGAVPYTQLPTLVAGLQVLILPYKVDASTVNINPLKLKEYIATGKPVITTPLPEAIAMLPHVTVAEAKDFPESVLQALKAGSAKVSPATEAWLAGESWEAKAKAFCEHCFDGMNS